MARCVGILSLICLLPAVALAQSGNETSVVRTPWGAPDLRGVWDYRTMTPLERSANFAAREFLSDEEAATYERQVLERRGSRPLAPGSTHAQWWLDQGTALTDDHRTSLIVDPPDGRIPPLTPEAQEWNAAQGGQRPVRARQVVNSSAHGPEDLGLAERCLLGYSTGPARRAQRVQQQHPAVPDTRPCGDLDRDGPRRAHRPVGRTTASPVGHPAMAGGCAWSLGGRHAGRPHHKLHRQDGQLRRESSGAVRVRKDVALDRAVHTHRRACVALRVHDRRPGHVHASVHGGRADAHERRFDL